MTDKKEGRPSTGGPLQAVSTTNDQSSSPPPGIHAAVWRVYQDESMRAMMTPSYRAQVERALNPRPRPPLRLADSPTNGNYALATVEKLANEVASSIEGVRNTTLNNSSVRAGRVALAGGVDLDVVRATMQDAGEGSGLPSAEVQKTIESALRKAEQDGPADIPESETYGDAYQLNAPEGDVLNADLRQQTGLRIETIRGADVNSQTAEYVWTYQGFGSIQRSTLALFGGRPGSGKSTCARWYTAQWTRGELPGCWHGKPQNVAYISSEESLEYTIVPSLRAVGADMGRVFFPDLRDPDDNQVRLLSLRDEKLLGDWLVENGITVLVVDPLMSTISGKTDINRNNEVRAFIEPWARIAQRIDGVVIGIAHLNKATTGDVVAGINGSSAFGEVARSVFGFAKDPDSDDGLRVMSQAKNSTGPESMSLLYRIESMTVTNDDMGRSDVARFVMLGDSDRSVSDILAGGMDRADGEAVSWLRDYLELNGRTPSKDVKRDGYKDAGHSERSIQRAGGKLRVVSERVGFPGQTYWSLPLARANADGATGTTGATGSPGDFSLDNYSRQDGVSQSRQSRQSGQVYAREDGATGEGGPQ